MLQPNTFCTSAVLEAEREQDLGQLTVGHTHRHRPRLRSRHAIRLGLRHPEKGTTRGATVSRYVWSWWKERCAAGSRCVPDPWKALRGRGSCGRQGRG